MRIGFWPSNLCFTNQLNVFGRQKLFILSAHDDGDPALWLKTLSPSGQTISLIVPAAKLFAAFFFKETKSITPAIYSSGSYQH